MRNVLNSLFLSCGLALSASAAPDSLSGLALWLDAADTPTVLTNATGTVTSWMDKSGLGRHAENVEGTPDIALNALNGQAVINFEGSAYLYTTYNFDALAEYTIFAVAHYLPGLKRRVISSRTRNWLFGYHGGLDQRWYAEGWISNAGDGNEDWHLHAGSVNSAADPQANFYKDGVLLIQDGTGSNNVNYKPGQLSLGAFQNQGQESSDCEVAEVIIYDRVLSPVEINQVGFFLQEKYGLAGAHFDPGTTLVIADAIDVTTNSGTIHGSVTTTGAVPATVKFFWGPSDGGTNHSAWANTTDLGIQGIGPVSTALAGLNPDSTYYYRLQATNATGAAWSATGADFHTDLEATTFARRMKISFCGYEGAETLNDFPLLVVLNESLPGFSYSDFTDSGSGSDLRFADANLEDALAFEVENWDSGGDSLIWVRVPELAPGTDHIWLLIGGANPAFPPFTTDGSTWEPAFRGVWHMNETLPPDASFPQANASANVETVSTVVGMVGNAQHLDNSYIQMDNPSHFDFQTAATVEAWVRVDGGWRSAWQAFVSKRGEGQGWQIRRYGNYNQGTFTLRGTTGPDEAWGVTDLNDGAWHHVLGSWDGQTRRLYVDGQLDNEFADTGLITLTTVNNEVKVGANDNGGRRHRGPIDEVRIADTNRSTDWIRATYLNIASNNSFNCFGPVEATSLAVLSNQGGATLITQDSATLNGQLSESYAGTPEVRVYFGPADGGTDSNAWAEVRSLGPLGPAPPAVTLSAALNPGDLSPDTLYFYRYFSKDGAATSWACESASFLTLGPPSLANTGAQSTSATTATLNGAYLNAIRGDITLYWGSADGDTNSLAWANAVPLGNVTGETFSAGVSGLVHGVQYFYRAFGSNADGSRWASSSLPFKTALPQALGSEGLIAHQYDTLNGSQWLAPLSKLQGQVETGSSPQIADLNYNGNFVASFPYITHPNNFSIIWEGLFVPNAGAGAYSFGINHDDRGLVAIDLDGNGVYDNQAAYDPGELVVDGTAANGTQTGTVTLEDRPYKIAIVLEQGGGGRRMTARWAPGTVSNFNSMSPVNGTSGVFFQGMDSLLVLENLLPTGHSPSSVVARAHFEGPDTLFDLLVFYGTTDGGTDTNAWQDAIILGSYSNIVNTNLSATLPSLATNTPYYYTFAASNCVGMVWAEPSIPFSTATAPVVGNGPGATGIGLGTATLNAELLAGGLADVTIYWGRSDRTTNATAWESSIPLGDLWTGFPDAETVNGVLYGIPYYYRAFASNAYGNAWADSTVLFKSAPLMADGTRGLTARVYEGMTGVNTNLEPISNAFALAATETNLWQDAALNYPNAGAIRAAFPALIDNDHMMVTWEGYIDTRIEGLGTYSFGTSSDDGSVVYIDLNHDGDFSDGFTPNTGNTPNPGGELIVDNNWNHGPLIQTGNVVLDAYGCYRIAFGFYETGGGESILVKYAKGADVPFAEMTFIDGSASSTQPFFPSCPPSLYAIYNDNPTGVTTTEATLNGILDASNAVYSAILYWGDEDGGMDTNAWDHAVPVGAFTNIAGISQLVALPSTGTYYYTWRATNCFEDLWAPDTFSFGTPTAPTIDNLSGASDIGIHAATVNGVLSAGGSAEITLYYGPSDGGTNSANWAFSSNIGTFGEGPLSATRDDFWYGVRWYYRMHASNPVGDDWADSTADFKTLTPTFAGTPGLLAHQYDALSGQTWINPISNLQAQTPSGTSTQSDPLNYDTRAGGTPFANPFVNTFPYITAGGTFAILWEGWFIPPNGAGTYTFGVEHDDRSMLALDLDGDGDFDNGTSYDGGELVVDAGTITGGCCGQQLGSVVLEDRPYRFATALEQGGGDRYMTVRWGFGTYATFAAIPNLADGSSGHFALVPSIEAWSLSGDPVTTITATTATLNGSLNTSGTVFDVSVYWGSSDGGTSTTSWASSANLGSYSNGAFALDHDLSGLTAGATYYYSFRATNCTEEIWADSGYFSTVFDVAGFTEQLKITFCGYNKPETLIDFPAMLVLSTNIPGFDYSAFVATDGGDLRFTDQAGALIDHEIETWGGTTDSDSVIWVEIPQLVDNTTYIFANWGNPGVTNLPPYASDGSTWADGLGIWHFADTNATDSSGNGWDGTGSGVTPTPGIANGALDFPGTVHAGPGLSFANQSFTVSAWARKEVNGQDGWLVSHGIPQANKGLHFGFRAGNNQFSFAFWSNDLNLAGFTDTSTWHYWTGVYDASASEQRLYRDGVLAGSRIAGPYQGDPSTLLRIGERFGNQQFIGEIDEVRLLGSAMSSNRVATTHLNIASNSTFICYGGPGPGDTDGDGMSDADEAIAGTDPLDPDSVLAVAISRGGNETTRTLNFPSAIGRTYDIHWRSELLSGTWIPLALSVAGTGSVVSIDHVSSEQTVYYRIEVNN